MANDGTLRALVLDDEPIMLSLLERVLPQLGVSPIAVCASGRKAVQELNRGPTPPDLVLVDPNMPQMDGVEFLRELVERQYSGAVILLSTEDREASQSVEKLAQAHRLTILGQLRKPVDPVALATLIRQLKTACADRPRAVKESWSADDVRAAIAKGELVNYYQPKVMVSTGELAGVEALVRWQHPSAGLVYPDEFIALAESYGLMGDLTRAVVVAALTQVRAWRQAGLALQLAVNASMDNLRSLDFPDALASLVSAAGLDPDSVMVEVTESRLMARITTALDVLKRLRLKHFHLSIDDFGTGHASLAQLRDVPFDELKVDRSIVHGAATDAKLRATFVASLEFGRQLNMNVVAEGVEDRADWDYVRETGCDQAQGYLIAKPMPAAELVDWATHWRARRSALIPPQK
jgi:EAL domain-containing protein (putative c-di-GMP-specific phosphodiesterase class I)/DNA-binding NarL/FixJ family response regulator